MRGHDVMSRYVDNVAATDEAFRNGWFHSQDLGFLTTDPDSAHRYVVITGRSKNIAKVHGESVSLDEMDRALRAMPTTPPARPSRTGAWGTRSSPGWSARTISDDEIHQRLAETFPETALPSRVARLAAVPRTPTGKVVRVELARLLAGEDPGGPTSAGSR